MPSRYNSYFPTNKISSGAGGKKGQAGKEPSMKKKPAFPSAKAGGKIQKDRSGGVYKCHVYPKSEGL
jgi:hypothetical protein